MFENRRVLISGGAGVIGCELVKKLHQQGAVVLVGDLKPRPLDWHESIQYRQGDMNLLEAWEVELFQPEFFFSSGRHI